VHAAPAVSCAKVHKKTHTSIQVQRRQSGIPRAMVLRLISCSPRRPGFLATVACGVASANLTPASGRQDHTTSPSASAPFVIDTSASTASRPASVTIANRPSVGRDGESYSLISISEKQKYFCKWDWTAQISLIRFNKLAVRRNGGSARRAIPTASFPDAQLRGGTTRRRRSSYRKPRARRFGSG
jgi:hypothetical protein